MWHNQIEHVMKKLILIASYYSSILFRETTTVQLFDSERLNEFTLLKLVNELHNFLKC